MSISRCLPYELTGQSERAHSLPGLSQCQYRLGRSFHPTTWRCVKWQPHRAPDLAAIRMNGLAHIRPCRLSREEYDRPCHVIWSSDPADRDVLGIDAMHLVGRYPRVARVHLELRRIDDAGSDNSHVDVFGSQLAAQGTAERDERRLGRGITGGILPADGPPERAEEYDPATPETSHPGQHRRYDIHVAGQIHIDLLPPLLLLLLKEWPHCHARGVADQHLDRSESRLDFSDHSPHGDWVGDVCRSRKSPHLAYDTLEPIVIHPCVDRNPSAFGRHAKNDALPDALRRACNQAHDAVELAHCQTTAPATGLKTWPTKKSASLTRKTTVSAPSAGNTYWFGGGWRESRESASSGPTATQLTRTPLRATSREKLLVKARMLPVAAA